MIRKKELVVFAFDGLTRSLFISKQEHEWLLSGDYASPQYLQWRLLWEELQNIAGEWSGPWLVVGDFNYIATSFEKLEGSRTLPLLVAYLVGILNVTFKRGIWNST